ncbi:MAG TPA: diadenylate cyclase CdaA [Bryobacteraceae bacterium]|nr:diadenylate cyclase CdaA [Bryobacteraceae bacterium]
MAWLPAFPVNAFSSFSITAFVDIVLVAFLIYQFILIIRGRRAAHILIGIAVLSLVYYVAVWARLELLRSVLATLVPYTGFALIVMFQSELRRMLARIGRRPFAGFSQLEKREVADEILLALGQLTLQKVGALIIVERNIGLRTFVESGVRLDAVISRDLLCSLFQPLGALHDGAVIVQGDRIAAAACFLPLTTNPLLATNLGTRHRAAIGVTEEADCIALVVSEETGRISMAHAGDIDLNVPLARVEQALTGLPIRQEARPTAEPVPAPTESTVQQPR